MKRLYDPSGPVLNPHDLVTAFTGKRHAELSLPKRAVIVFDAGDLKRILRIKKHSLINAWLNFRWIYRIDGSDTIITKSYFGGPNIAALVEELAAFGVLEFVLWGYAGGIDGRLAYGDVVVAKAALREDGVSQHYLDSEEGFVYTDWFEKWAPLIINQGYYQGAIWSCDAIYRETRDKIIKYRNEGISAVEMEVASFYAVCKLKGLKGIAFLVISDVLDEDKWAGGFHTKALKEGVNKLTAFMLDNVFI